MQHVLVFSTSAPQITLNDEMIGGLLLHAGLPSAAPPATWLAPGQAAEVPVSQSAAPNIADIADIADIAAMRQAGEAIRVDVNLVAVKTAGNGCFLPIWTAPSSPMSRLMKWPHLPGLAKRLPRSPRGQ
jgi:hypothetical protein